jgi:hypothetical protein
MNHASVLRLSFPLPSRRVLPAAYEGSVLDWAGIGLGEVLGNPEREC